MIIRPEQQQQFERAAVPQYESEAAGRLKEDFPKHAEILGDAGLRARVNYAVEHAASYGITDKGPVNLFLDLTLLLGIGFDQDPQLPWASSTLSGMTTQTQETVSRRLYAEAATYLDRASGPANEWIDAALKRIHSEPMDVDAHPNYDQFALERLHALWPEKYAYLGEETARTLIHASAQTAQQHGISGASGRHLILCLMYFLGSAFDRDPMFSWAGKILNDPGMRKTPTVHLTELRRQALAFALEWQA